MSPAVATDAEAILESLQEPESFGSIFVRHHRSVAAYLAATVDAEAAQDLVSETFLRAFVCRHRFRSEYDSACGWLLGIAGNLRRMEARRAAREARACVRLVLLDGHDDPIPALLNRLDAAAAARTLGLWTAVGALQPSERDALLLYALGGLSYSEIAVATGVPIGTVRSRLSRARTKVAGSCRALVSGDQDSSPPDRSCVGRTQSCQG
jgi:RNA polymerase sigma-70 factor (ECF subfamily)